TTRIEDAALHGSKPMAKLEVEQESGAPSQSPPLAELVIRLPGLVDVVRLRRVAAQWSGTGRPIAVVHPSVPGMNDALDSLGESANVRLVAREIPAGAISAVPWLGSPAVYSALLAEAESLSARACVIL